MAAAIRAGYIDVGIGSGFESMSQHYGPQALAVGVSPRLLSYSKDSSDCLTPMGITSEEVAERYEICRETQDQFAYESCTKASKAQKDGLFESEIVPVHLIDGDEVISRDDSIREGVTLEQLRKLKPAFKPDGSTTAGNASKVCDGASAVLLMKRSVAIANNLKVRARLISFVVVGVPPGVMGIGPAFAIPKALEAARVQKEDISVFEINEAFASQAAYCAKELGIDRTRLNPRGGAIAFGHPLGCTGARQIATLLPQLKVTSPIKGRRLGVVSMCVGTGMGAACVVESEEC